MTQHEHAISITDQRQREQILKILTARRGWCVPCDHLMDPAKWDILDLQIAELRKRGHRINFVEVKRKMWGQWLFETYYALEAKP